MNDDRLIKILVGSLSVLDKIGVNQVESVIDDFASSISPQDMMINPRIFDLLQKYDIEDSFMSERGKNGNKL